MTNDVIKKKNNKNEKKKNITIEINWAEIIIPLFFLSFCISYTIQIIHINFLSIAFASISLILMIPILMVLFLRNIKIVKREKVNESKSDSVKKSKTTLFQLIITNIINILNIKKIRLIITFLLCFGVIGNLFGFIYFILFFNMLTLFFLGVKKVFYIIIFSCIITFLLYYVFGKILYVPFPQGFVFETYF